MSSTTVLRLPLEARVSWSNTEHVYRLPRETQWTHYKVTLHGAMGHQQRIPFLILNEHYQDPSAEWLPLPPIHSELLRIGIPPTVSSEHCTVTILLRGDGSTV